MIKLKDIKENSFTLLKARAKDSIVYASRADIREAIKRKGKYNFLNIRINEDGYILTRVRVNYRNDELRLGCHTFDQKTSRIIVRWANAK
jgi:hypothetical protein